MHGKEKPKFNLNVNIMNNSIKPQVIQLMVQQYLYDVYNEYDIKLYSEIINDIDAFNDTLDNIKTAIYFNQTGHNVTIAELLSIVNNSDYNIEYHSSYEVKNGNTEYLSKFSTLFQIIQKINYPNSCRLELIIVPNEYYPDTKYFQNQIDYFERLKKTLSELDLDTRRWCINQLIHDTSEHDKCIVSVAMKLVLDIQNKLLKSKYKEMNEKLQQYCDDIYTNIIKTKIRLLRLCDLCKRGISPEILENVTKYNAY